jgi:hypothetical protein
LITVSRGKPRHPTPVAKPETSGDGSAIAASGRLAWAAGVYCPKCTSGHFTNLPFTLRWTGTAWKRIPVPTQDLSILGLAVTSATNAWAVGGTSPANKTFIVHWNGFGWH